MRSSVVILFGLVLASAGNAAIIEEGFSSDPSADGWKTFGNAGLFSWDATNQDLQVTWDTSQTNSYYYHGLGTILNSGDSFGLSFDLAFQDYTIGTTPGRPFTFAAAVGFMNFDDATRTNFFRGSGANSQFGPDNLMEFDFFPAFDVYLPTISQVIVSTNNGWLYNDDNLLDMTAGQTFHINMAYDGRTRTLTTTLTTEGVQFGQTQTIVVPANFDFRLNTISVSSYSDQESDGSLLAHGTLDNLLVTVPPPPIQNLTGALSNGVWRVQFSSRTNWQYTLERTLDFRSWTDVSPRTAGTAGTLILPDNKPLTVAAWYRVRAERP